MSDVECPYCGADQEICHDDGYGYDEDAIHQQTCGECSKVFAYTTAIIMHYEAMQADCLNGGAHAFVRRKRFGIHGARDVLCCSMCDHEEAVPVTQEDKKCE